MAEKPEIVVHADVLQQKVSRYLYSHFIEHIGRCIYEGIWVGEDSPIPNDGGIRLDTVAALKKVALPALRWPGGCFADNYHWMDGIGPREKRPRQHNLWWNQPETNEFGTDEFMRFCRMVGSEPYICLNVGSGTVEEAQGWVEYCNSEQNTALTQRRRANGHAESYEVKFWGVGNENWGCGGTMTPEDYAALYRRFATYAAQRSPGIRLIACGSHRGIPEWDERFLIAMRGAYHLVHYLALHIYSGAGSDTKFSDEEYLRLIGKIEVMDTNLTRACGLAQAFSTYGHPIGIVLDEWGTWYKEATTATGNFQQNTLRDALFTAASFHCFHKFADRLFMTNMAQTMNVLQALVLTRGAGFTVTPTYHVYEMFMPHRDGNVVPCAVKNGPTLALPEGRAREAVSVSATRSADGRQLFMSLVNLDLRRAFPFRVRIAGEQGWKVARVRRLTAGDVRVHNTFEEPNKVQPKELRAQDVSLRQGLRLPPLSVTTILLQTAGEHG